MARARQSGSRRRLSGVNAHQPASAGQSFAAIGRYSVKNFLRANPRVATPMKVAPPDPSEAYAGAPTVQRAAVLSIATTSAPSMMTAAQRPRSDES